MDSIRLYKEIQGLQMLIEQDYSLAKFEALQIAVQIQQNSIRAKCFGVTSQDSTPAFLEAIAMSLGYNESEENICTLVRVIGEIAENINSLAYDLPLAIRNLNTE